jgi:hypothetical protein
LFYCQLISGRDRIETKKAVSIDSLFVLLISKNDY